MIRDPVGHDERVNYDSLFSPVLILRQPERIQRKLFSVEPLRETWP